MDSDIEGHFSRALTFDLGTYRITACFDFQIRDLCEATRFGAALPNTRPGRRESGTR